MLRRMAWEFLERRRSGELCFVKQNLTFQSPLSKFLKMKWIFSTITRRIQRCALMQRQKRLWRRMLKMFLFAMRKSGYRTWLLLKSKIFLITAGGWLRRQKLTKRTVCFSSKINAWLLKVTGCGLGRRSNRILMNSIGMLVRVLARSVPGHIFRSSLWIAQDAEQKSKKISCLARNVAAGWMKELRNFA